MARFSLGVVLEPLGLAPRAAIEKAATIGAACVQFDAVGDLRPDALGATGRREIKTILRSYQLKLAAVQIPLRRGLDSFEGQQERIDHVRKVIDFASELGATCVVVPCPKLPGEADTARAKTLRESLEAIGTHGTLHNTVVALECGLDAADVAEAYFATFDAGLRVTFDPANFAANGHDPLTVLPRMTSRVVHMQARDVRSGSLSGGANEVAVGAGDIDWLSLMATLNAIDYHGGIVVDREGGPQRRLDIESGLKFLQRFSGPSLS